jgi:hypothetical protein
MLSAEEMYSLVLRILEAGRRSRRRLTAEAHRRGLTLEELLAAAITEAVREANAAGTAPRRFALADVGGVHYWTGADFLPVSAWVPGTDIPCFPTRAEAEAEARRLQQSDGLFLVVVPFPA